MTGTKGKVLSLSVEKAESFERAQRAEKADTDSYNGTDSYYEHKLHELISCVEFLDSFFFLNTFSA